MIEIDVLNGGKVIDTGLDDSTEMPYIIIKKGKKEYLVLFSRDPEMNGPGTPLVFHMNEETKAAQ